MLLSAKEENVKNLTWGLYSVHLILKLNFSRTILRQEAGRWADYIL